MRVTLATLGRNDVHLPHRRRGGLGAGAAGRAVHDLDASAAGQVALVANAFYQGEPDLLLLVIDTDRVTQEIRYERVPGQDQPYPHIYGPLNVAAVVQARPFQPGPDGQFSFRG